jgi:nucleotide-binding universal stress UspA family protein
MSRIRRVLHASDFSPASRVAFARAVDMAKDNRAELLLVHVLTPVMPIMAGDGYVSPKTYEDIEASTKAAGQKGLAALVAKARKAGARVKAVMTDGLPHEQILRLARAKHADVVVLGTHGRTGLARFFLGSVANRVVAMSLVPVLTVRGK